MAENLFKESDYMNILSTARKMGVRFAMDVTRPPMHGT